MAFDVWSADTDAQRWRELIAGLAPHRRDVHFLPEYGRIYADAYRYKSLLAVYEEGGESVVQAFVRRPLHDLPFLAADPKRTSFADIANPYGYGGPLCTAANPEEYCAVYRNFDLALSAWCREEGIASEFAILHPLLFADQLKLIGDVAQPKYQKDVVVMDLTAAEEEMAAGLRKGHRSALRVAQRAGVLVERVTPSQENIAIFCDLYVATMRRRDAAARWFLPRDFFALTVHNLGPQRTSLFFASLDGKVESACLLMHDFETAYYHFAGTRAEHPEVGAGSVLVWEAALWARGAGYRHFHLGGGVTSDPEDSLFRFKSGFSKVRAPVYTYFRVRDEAVYEILATRKRAHELGVAGAESLSNFEPIYRRE